MNKKVNSDLLFIEFLLQNSSRYIKINSVHTASRLQVFQRKKMKKVFLSVKQLCIPRSDAKLANEVRIVR